MAPIDFDDEVQDFLQTVKDKNKDAITLAKEAVQEMAEVKPDPKMTIDPVFAVNINGLTHPVSPNEEQMMQLFTQAPLSNAYNLPSMFQLQYPMDVASIILAINILVKRHDVLRSTWHMGESTVPCRRINQHCQGDCQVLYISKASDARKLMIMDNQRAFQIGVYAARFQICAVVNDRGKQDTEVAPFVGMNLHHTVADADGQYVAAQELDLILSYVFRGFSEQAIMQRLPPIPVQFSDYAYWQQSLQARGLLKPDLAVWFTSITASCPPMVLDAPLDKPRSRMYSATGSCASIRMDQELLQPVLERITTTPYAIVFTNFTIALARLCGQSRVNVAIPFGTRASPTLYPLVGSFLNMLPATFEYLPSESYGAVLDRGSTIQLAARKHALAPYLTVVNMLRGYYNPQFDPSRNPVYQSMVDLIPGGNEFDGPTMPGVIDIFAFAKAPGGMMRLVEVGYNSNLYTKATAHRMCMQMKAIAHLSAHQATQGLHALYTQPLPKHLPSIEEAHDAATNASLGSFPLKIHGMDKDAKTVSLVSGFELKGTPDEYDFYRRSVKFARHSGVMPTTDVGHPLHAPQYQIPPKPPKKKGQPVIDINLPERTVDEGYKSAEANPNWRPEDAQPAARGCFKALKGTVDMYDARNGFGLISSDSVNDPIPFFKSGLPMNERPSKKSANDLKGRRVAFSYYDWEKQPFATGLRFLDAPVQKAETRVVKAQPTESLQETQAVAPAYQRKIHSKVNMSKIDEKLLTDVIYDVVQDVVGYEMDFLEDDLPLMQAGIASRQAVNMRAQLEDELGGLRLPSTVAFDFPSIAAIRGYIIDSA